MHTDALTCLPACTAVSHSAWRMCISPERCRSYSSKYSLSQQKLGNLQELEI
jgi:hypothetical protein